MMAELLAKKPKWRNLFSPVVQGIEWDMVNGYPITLEDYKKGKITLLQKPIMLVVNLAL